MEDLFLFLFVVEEEELNTTFWIDFVNLETTLSISRGDFRGKFRLIASWNIFLK
jgi:hypothetical protein